METEVANGPQSKAVSSLYLSFIIVAVKYLYKMASHASNPLAFIPDFIERKGSLFLRSDHMDYGRPTLVSNW